MQKGDFILKGCGAAVSDRLMGIAEGAPWARGERGWGTGPSRTNNGKRLVTWFQQNAVLLEFQMALGSVDRDFLVQAYGAASVPSGDGPIGKGDTAEAHGVRMRETASDMFLNWVYRRIAQPTYEPIYCDTRPEATSWEGPGFLNRSWRTTDTSGVTPTPAAPPPGTPSDTLFNGTTGVEDAAQSGTQRYWWMHQQMIKIFNAKAW